MRRNLAKTIWMALMIAVLLVAAACGSTDKNENAPAPASTNTQTEPATASPPAAEQENATRVVTDQFGEVEIPTHPQRVAAIYLEDYMTLLGVEPIVQWYHPWWGKQDYLELDVPLFDFSGSIEALLDQDPDLIIVDGGVDKVNYDLYSKVAPTFRLPDEMMGDSKAIMKTLGDVLGIPEKADAALQQYTDYINDAKAKLTEAVGDETVIVLRVEIGEKSIVVFGTDNVYSGMIYNELGLKPHRLAEGVRNEVLSEELISELDADHIIVFPSGGDWDSPENQADLAFMDGPLWKGIAAVKNGHVYKVERSHWQSGAMKANMMKADDLVEMLLK
jgi:iron complex transport system substrate-binding protein